MREFPDSPYYIIVLSACRQDVLDIAAHDGISIPQSE